MRPIVFLTDFGLEDAFVGTCHAVMRRIAPGLEIVDLTHGIAPQSVLQGAVALHDAAPYLPTGAVVVAVVDPGVGSSRRGLAVRGADRRFYVGPDNGVLLLAAEREGPLYEARELQDPRYRLEPVAATFHGRDVFAPAAAHLAAGVPLTELGPALDSALLVRLELPEPAIGTGLLRATVLGVDRYGNVQLAGRADDLAQAGLAGAAEVAVAAADGQAREVATVGRTFADVPAGGLLLHEDSSGRLALAVAHGSAAARLGLGPGDAATLVAAPGDAPPPATTRALG